ncbi:MAG: hypothetical protein GX572_04030 [Clostridia bacterium]|nr:hypothetical protein [Clostridia bacterium]
MKKLKIAAAMILPLLIGPALLILIGGSLRQAANIEPFFTLWLILLPAIAGWTAGWQYPRRPLFAGWLTGLLLSLGLALLMILFLPQLAWPLLLLFLAACAVAIAGAAAFAGAVGRRARALLLREREVAAEAAQTEP